MRLYRQFLLKAIEGLDLNFEASAPNPIVVLRGLLNGSCSEDQRSLAHEAWCNAVVDHGIFDFRSESALLARLALCLVAEHDVSQLGDDLSWFIEVLGLLGKNARKAVAIMESHFQFQEP